MSVYPALSKENIGKTEFADFLDLILEFAKKIKIVIGCSGDKKPTA